jgi:hypothetical protein
VTQLLTCPEGIVAHLGGEICVLRLQGSLGPRSVARIEHLADQMRTAECTSVLVDASLLGAVTGECAMALGSLWDAVQMKGMHISAYGATGEVADTLDSIEHHR